LLTVVAIHRRHCEAIAAGADIHGWFLFAGVEECRAKPVFMKGKFKSLPGHGLARSHVRGSKTVTQDAEDDIKS
jgi:hypothetical protein